MRQRMRWERLLVCGSGITSNPRYLMAHIKPFCALRYNEAVVSSLSDVLSPPYDVISASEQDALYNTSPYNIVRLILGKQSATDSERENRYTRAQRDFNAWRASTALRVDSTPAFYVLTHRFDDRGRPQCRMGFLGLLQLDEAIERIVYRHEATLAAPKADRTKLLQTVPANLEPIFCVYPDAGGILQARLQQLTQHTPPTAQASLKGQELKLWAVTDPEIVEAVQRQLASVSVLIADGHHRFEVAYAHRAAYGSLMSYFVSMEDPALVVRPIHRLVSSAGPKTLEILRTLCVLEPARDLASLTTWLEEGSHGSGRFGYAEGSALYQVTVQPGRMARWLMAPTVPLPLAVLDVSVLHGMVLPALSIDNSALRYTADAVEAVQSVQSGSSQAAWLLRGIPLPQVYALAAKGFVMPPKSTFFYPKVPSGLTIHPFDATREPVLP